MGEDKISKMHLQKQKTVGGKILKMHPQKRAGKQKVDIYPKT